MIIFDLIFGWLNQASTPSPGHAVCASITNSPRYNCRISLRGVLTMPTTALRNGADNCLAFVFKNKDGTPATGKTVTFYVIDAALLPDEAAKLGSTYDIDGELLVEGIYECVERIDIDGEEDAPGTYDGVFPYEPSKELNVQGRRKYRVVPLIDGEFRGDDQIWFCEYA